MDASTSETSFAQRQDKVLPTWLRGRRGLVLAAIALAAPAIWLGWPWLLAAGAVPLLVSLAPCLIMCGLGFCMMKSCSKQGAPGTASAATDGTPGHQNASLPPGAASTAFSQSHANRGHPAETKAPSRCH